MSTWYVHAALAAGFALSVTGCPKAHGSPPAAQMAPPLERVVVNGDISLQGLDPVSSLDKARERLAQAESRQILAGQQLQRAALLVAARTMKPDLFERREQAYRRAEAAAQLAYAELRHASTGRNQIIASSAGFGH